MFDIGFMELFLIGVVALLVVGPERLPRLARTVGLWLGKARRFMTDVKSDISAEMREQDLAALKELKGDLQQARDDLTDTTASLKENLSDDSIMDEIKRPARARSGSKKKKTGKNKKSPSRPAAGKSAKQVAKKSSAKKSPDKKKATTKKAAAKKTTTKKASASKKKKSTKRARS